MNLRDAVHMTDEQLAEVLDFADVLSGWVKSVRAEAYKRAHRQNGCVPGWKLAPGKSSYDFKDPNNAPEQLIELGLTEDEIYGPRPLISQAQAKAVLKGKFRGRGHDGLWKKFDEIIKKSPGTTTLVRATDGREEVRRGHEFKELAEKTAKTAKTEVDDLL